MNITLLIKVDSDKLLMSEPMKDNEEDRLGLAFELLKESGIYLTNTYFLSSGMIHGELFNFYEVTIKIDQHVLYMSEVGRSHMERVENAFNHFNSNLFGDYGIVSFGEVSATIYESSSELQASN